MQQPSTMSLTATSHGPESFLPVAQAIYNQSLSMPGDPRGSEKMRMHFPATMTAPFTDRGMERPFFTTKDGLMGVLTIHDSKFIVHSVQPTNTFARYLKFEYFKPLPLSNNPKQNDVQCVHNDPGQQPMICRSTGFVDIVSTYTKVQVLHFQPRVRNSRTNFGTMFK